ncbi:divergent polysaccharide deacetylase family protein [Roseinatronobacter alkalisoli]|uniref:Divergent polysaccharide deacetylase family protein n=1 Tax=Roseinatronobacter alkalisoli TaxID=3028235 RepID=A0ABT5T4I6_9RHOB|nr:divergent polysaccharide deacetylase family protein [Roseinatronobacter sp. HJB301]MDD7970033.1 divergent polysaccharide deacetylase family protein [Roseinatronobacter sp. HJB301]
MNSIGVAGFGLGLAIAVAGLVGVAVVFPLPSPEVPAQPVMQQTSQPPAPEPVTPAPELTLSDADDPGQDDGVADIPEPQPPDTAPTPVPTEPDLPRPVATADMADAPPPTAPDSDQPAVMPDATGDLVPLADLPDMPSPNAEPAQDQPRSTGAPAAILPDTTAMTVPPQAVDTDMAPLVPQHGMPMAALSIPQGPEGAPHAPDGVPQIDPPPPAAPADAAPVIDAVEPPAPEGEMPPAPADDLAEPETPATPRDTMPGTRISGLPGMPRAPRDPIPALPDAGPAADAPHPLTALERNAIAVDPTPGGALMALVLHDPGLPMPMRRDLAARELPFTVALNPMDPSAAEAAELYHQSGKEVLILANGIPARATPSDIDVTFGAYFENVPLAAGVIDLPRDGFVRNAQLLSEVMKVIARDGYGLVTFAGGTGQAARSAQSMGVPHAEVFRSLDAGDESAITIRRFLDRAVFQASQVGYVIVFGEASNESTLNALDLWQSEGRVDQIDLVPVSSILLSR